MKRVLILAEIFFPEKYPINDLYFDWENKGYNVDVFTRNPSYPNDEIFEGYSKSVFNIEKRKTGNIYRSLVFTGYKKSKVIKILNYLNYNVSLFIFLLRYGRKYDEIFFYQTGPLTNVFAASILKFLFRYKIVIWIQDLWPQTLYAYGVGTGKITKILVNTLVTFIYKRSDRFVVSSEGFGPYLKTYGKPVEWIPNWLTSFGDKDEEEKELDGKFNFTFAGNIGKAQKMLSVVKGFKNIGEEHDAYLNIIGDGSMAKDVRSIVEEENIKNVRFYGFLPINITSGYLKKSDVLIMPLESEEAFIEVIPGKFQSYLNNAKPIFAITNGVTSRYVLEYSLGYTADPNDIKEIEGGFLKFIKCSNNSIEAFCNNCTSFNDAMFRKDLLLTRFDKLIFQEE